MNVSKKQSDPYKPNIGLFSWLKIWCNSFFRKLGEVLTIESYHNSLPEACVLDYYVAGFWYPFHRTANSYQNSVAVKIKY